MQFILPHLGEGIHDVELVRWLVAPGAAVRAGDVLMEVLTDKATMEVPAPFAGVVREVRGAPGDRLNIGQEVLTYDAAGAEATPVKAAPEAVAVAKSSAPRVNGTAPVAAPASVKAAPSVRHMARKLGIDLAAVRGTGPGGRVLIEDLAPKMTPSAPAKPTAPKADYGKPGTRVKLAGLRRTIADAMVRSKRTAPHYSYVDEFDATALVGLRNSLKETFDDAGVKLTYLPFIVKAVASALRDMPVVNASLDDDAGEIVYHDRYDVGIAVAAPAGLIVPVVREAHKKDVAAIARDIERLSSEARAGRSKREDVRGSTFTVTSVGGIGGLFSTPVLNHPEVGIMGVGKVTRRPVFDERDNVKAAEMMYLSFTFDHRVVDGAVGAVFANAVIKRLSQPARLLLPERL